MSTGLECQFVEVAPGRWFYLLEDGSAPKMAWDWREYATATGPFTSYESAHEHLRDHHANPGGHTVQEHAEGFVPDDVLAGLIESAFSAGRFS